jgi:DNA topoisomerase-1
MIRYFKRYLKPNNLILFGGGDKPQWTVLCHNGPMFAPLYIPHNTPVIINNMEVVLPPLAEEYATMYVKYFDTEWIKSNLFKKNFWKDFKPTLNNLADSLDNIDFSLIKKYTDMIKEKKSLETKEEKESRKNQQDIIDEPYKNCIIDGTQQKIGNYKIEPPGIFTGRGDHPKQGRIKKRITPEDVTINIDKECKVPIPNVPGNWGNVIHDRTVIWLATWKENILGKNKYIFTSLDSFFKSKSDESKFDLARTLKKKASTIRETYEKQLEDPDMKTRQKATALYFIDHLALRVGGKKDTKDEADTVGVTSLRVEHIILLDNNNIKLDFLGKDSVRYTKKVSVPITIYNNLQEFIKNKSKKEDLFDMVNSAILNDYLTQFMKGLTAKVWRTYNASYTFQKEIDKIKEEKITASDENDKLNILISLFNQANTSVALLCNHQKGVSKKLDEMTGKIDIMIKKLKQKKAKLEKKKINKEKIEKIENKIKLYKLKKETKIKMKNVSLSTSKNNYIDPRIIFAFAKRFNIPPEKLLTPQLVERFKWATIVDKDYKF